MGKRVFKGKKNLAPTKSKAKSLATQDSDDDIDTFVNKRNQISFEDNSEESDNDVEPVYDLDQFENDEEENGEGEDDLSEDEDDLMAGANLNDDSDEDEEDEVDEDEMLSKWGKSKRAFYNNEYEKNKDVEAEEFEENEVKRVRSKKLAQLDEEDLEDEFLSAKQASKSKEQTVSSDDKLLQAMNKELGSINLEGADMDVEQIKKDTSGLTSTQKLEILVNESPVLLQLLQEFKQRMAEINNNIKPVLQKVQSGQVATTKGVSYLEAKFHLLLSYCINIAFYLLLKASGKAVKDHPVIDQLVKIRTILEKLKPLDQKLKNQIDKLLKMAITGTISQDDPKAHRPNPSTMLKPGENEVEDGEPVNDEDNVAQSVDAEYDSKGVYKIPKLAEMYYEDKSLAAQQKKRERLLQRAKRSELMKEIVNELGEHPEEAPVIGAETDEMDDEERERQQYEEDNYIRFTLSKKDKSKMLQKQRKKNSIDNLEDFDDIAVLDGGSQSGGSLASILKKKNMREVIDDIVKDKKTKSNGLAGDLDLPFRDPEEAAAQSKKRKDYRKQLAQENDLNDDYDDFYTSKNKKPRQLEDYSSSDEARLQQFGEDFDGKRAIGRNIESNRGLTKHRNKKTKNPRTKLRNKFEKAVQKRKSQVRDFKRPQGGYGGESTGIKTHVVRSRKL